MESGWPVEIPRARTLASVGTRRHRRLTVPSGLLLFVCIFLPAVRGCGEPVVPLEVPYFWHPYLYGAVLAIAALATTVRGVRRAVLALRVLAYACIAGAIILVGVSPGLGVVELVLGSILLAIIGPRGSRGAREKRVAITSVVVSVLSLLWFGLWAGSAGALVGVYVALASAIFLLAGSLLWLSEI